MRRRQLIVPILASLARLAPLALAAGCASSPEPPVTALRVEVAHRATSADPEEPTHPWITLDVEAEDAALADLVAAIGSAVSWNVRVDPGLDARISVSLHDVEWREALDVIARMAIAEVVPMPDHLRLRSTCVRSYLTTADASARTVLQLVAAYLGCDLAFAPHLDDRLEAPLPPDLFGDDALPPLEALDRVTSALGIAWKRVDGHLRVGPQDWVERLPPD